MGAAKTPSSLLKESVGSMSIWIAKFTDIDDTDTYASGITDIVAAWCDATDVPTGASYEGIDVGYTSAGAITFNTGEDNRTGNLYILAGG